MPHVDSTAFRGMDALYHVIKDIEDAIKVEMNQGFRGLFQLRYHLVSFIKQLKRLVESWTK